MSQTDPPPSVVGISTAGQLLSRSRATIYKRLESGDLERGTDAQGRAGVTLASIHRYLENPPPGSWRSTEQQPVRSHETDSLRAENMKLREVIARLQIANEDEAAAQRHEEAANRHLRKALKEQARAAKRRKRTSEHIDEFLTLFLTPDDPRGADRT